MIHSAATFLLPVAAHVLVASCKATLVIAFVLLCRRAFATRLSSAMRHLLWLAVIVALLLPVGFDVPVALRTGHAAAIEGPGSVSALVPGVPALMPSPGIDPVPGSAPREPAAVTGGQPPHAPAIAQIPPALTLVQVLALLWGAGALVLLVLLVRNVYKYRGITARSTAISGAPLELLLRCRDLLEWRRDVRLVESAEIPAPLVLGWRSPVLLLPAGLCERLDQSQLRHVFLHELAHLRRHDLPINWLATCAQILHWFNPVVWHGLQVMRSDMEQASDALALRKLPTGEHADYGQTLITLTDTPPVRIPAHGLGVLESRSQLRERITLIATSRLRQEGSPVVAAILLLALTSVAAMEPKMTNAPVIAEAPVAADATAQSGSVAGTSNEVVSRGSPPAPVNVTAMVPEVAEEGPAVPLPVPAPRVAMEGQVQGARAAAPFTVRMVLQGVDPGSSPAAGFLSELDGRLRAIPGLQLIPPDTVAVGGPADFEMRVGTQGEAFMFSARKVGPDPSGRSDAMQDMISRGLLPGFTVVSTIGNEDREFRMDTALDQIRASLFPEDPAFQRDLRARIQDPQLEFRRRQMALQMLLQSGRVPYGSLPDPELIRLGAQFAATLSDPGQRGLVWSLLSQTGSPELPTVVAQALETEQDADARLLLVTTVARDHPSDASVRAILQDLSQKEPRPVTREVARQILAGEQWQAEPWRQYVLATVKNGALTDAQRLDPLADPSLLTLAEGQSAPDDETLRALGSMLKRADSYSHAVMGAGYVLARASGPVAREVIADVVKVTEGQTAVLEQIRLQLLGLQMQALRSDPAFRDVVADISERDPDAGMRSRARQLLNSAR